MVNHPEEDCGRGEEQRGCQYGHGSTFPEGAWQIWLHALQAHWIGDSEGCCEHA